jgi:hypothetical protein
MERSQLQAVIDNLASTPQERAAAQAALDGHADPVALHSDTRMMLAALKVERIADLNEEICQRHCAAHCVRHTDGFVKEFRYWIPPDDKFLACIGMSRRDWWNGVLDMAVSANRPYAVAHARRKLHELERQS